MKNGKKTVALRLYRNMLKLIRSNGHMNPWLVLRSAIENASPAIMIKSVRVWWSVYQVPLEVKPKKKIFFACKWIIGAARAKTGKSFDKLLSEEVLAAYANQWSAVKKKEEVQKMAEANRAFAYMAKYVK